MQVLAPTTLADAELLRQLVAFDSRSANSNLPIADFICTYLDRPGTVVERWPSPDGQKVNLVVRMGPEVDPDTRAGLVLSGHLDVVPADEPDWQSDPFELQESATAYSGRGTADMKGFVALAVNLAAQADPQTLRAPLWLILTYDEEVGTVGARDLVRAWPAGRALPRRAIVGEPTSLQAIRMHKGHAKLRIVLTGQSAHSGYPHLGDNAIEPGGLVITALARLRQELQTETCPQCEFFPEVPYVALNLARVRAGTAINMVPDRFELELGFRVLPGMSTAAITTRIRACVEQALGNRAFALESLGESPPFCLDAESDLYQSACALLGQNQSLSAAYATDAGWLETLGIDCLLWGPGSITVAHRANEWLPKNEFSRAPHLLQQLIARFCAKG